MNYNEVDIRTHKMSIFSRTAIRTHENIDFDLELILNLTCKKFYRHFSIDKAIYEWEPKAKTDQISLLPAKLKVDKCKS